MDKLIEEENGINIHYQEDYDTANLPLHFHYRHEIVFVIEGSSKFTINKKKYILQRNSILFISSLETHDFEILEYPYKRYIISMNNDFALTMLKQPILLSILLHRPANFCHSTNIGKYESE